MIHGMPNVKRQTSSVWRGVSASSAISPDSQQSKFTCRLTSIVTFDA